MTPHSNSVGGINGQSGDVYANSTEFLRYPISALGSSCKDNSCNADSFSQARYSYICTRVRACYELLGTSRF